MDNSNQPGIVEAPLTEAERKDIAFPENGEVVTNVLGSETGEKVVYDYQLDENGAQVLGEDGQPVVIGWHKEARS